jgi:hypothetical protein
MKKKLTVRNPTARKQDAPCECDEMELMGCCKNGSGVTVWRQNETGILIVKCKNCGDRLFGVMPDDILLPRGERK